MESVRQDKVQVKLEIMGNQARQELENLERKAKVLNDELKGFKEGTEDYIKASKKLDVVEKEMAKATEKIKLSDMSIQQLEKNTNKLRREFSRLSPTTEEFIQKSKELQESKARLDEVKAAARGIGDELDKTSGGFLDFVKKSAVFTGVYMGIEGAIQGIKQLGSESINSAAKTSDSLADIQKSTGMTKLEVDELNESLKLIDTRTTQEDLQGIAFVGGQIGVATDQVEGFTESVDKAVVALGDEFTGGAEEVATKMGTLQKLFKETKDLDAGEAINKIGSAINALGADGTATGPVVADFTQRIGQLGDLSPEISETLGLGAAFQELGLSAEISSGGLTNVLLTAAKDTAGFAAQLGITEKQFKELINSDPNEVILQLAESLKGASSTQITQTLDALGIKSQEATKVMSLLASKTDFVREKQALASTEMEKATSLTEEFNIKNTTAAAEIEKSEKRWAAYKDEIGKGLIPVYLKYLQIQGTVIDVLRALPGFVRENKIALLSLVAGLVIWNKELIVTNALTLKDVAWKQIQTLWTARLMVAQKGLNASMRANPIGAVVTVVSLLVMGFTALYNKSQTVRAGVSGLFSVFKEFMSLAGDIALFLINPLKNAGKLAEIKNAGERLGNAFSEGYTGKIAEENKKQDASDKTRRDKQVQDEIKTTEDKVKALTAIQRRQLDQYRKLVDETRDYASALSGDELKKLQKALAAEQKKKDEENKKRREQQEKDELDAARKLHDLKNELIANEYDKKIAILQTNAEREIAQAKGTEEQIAEQRRLIETKLSADIAAIEKARADERLKLAEQTAQAEQEIRNRYTLAKADLGVLQAEENLKSAIAEAGITNRFEKQKQAEEDLLSAKQNVLDREREIRMQAMEQDAQDKLQADILNLELSGEEKQRYELDAQAALDVEKELLDAEHQQRKDDLHKQYTDTQAEREKQAQMQAVGTMQQATDGFFQLKQLASDREMAKLDKDKQKRLKNLDAEYKSGKISKEQYENSKSAIESNYDAKARAIKKKAAEDEKAANIANSIMAGALAVIKAAPNIPLQIATGILALASTAKIIATPVPTFAKGGIIGGAFRTAKRLFSSGGAINPVAGVPNVGQSHDNGGIKMMDGATGEYLGEWERGEPYMILSKNTYANNKPVIDALLDSSLYRNGAPIKKNGGIYAADGAVTGPMPSGSGAAASGSESFDVLVNEVRGMRNDIQSLPRNHRAYVVYADIEEAAADINQVRADAAG